MKVKTILNVLIISSILLILYFFAGHDFVKFYLGGKTEILEAGAHINRLCNANKSCPTALDGWRKSTSGSERQFKNNMVYLTVSDDGSMDSKKYQAFRLIYSFIMPDHWFEVQGGVGKQVTSGWESR